MRLRGELAAKRLAVRHCRICLIAGSSVLGGSLASPCDAITGYLRSARRRRHAPGNGRDKAGHRIGPELVAAIFAPYYQADLRGWPWLSIISGAPEDLTGGRPNARAAAMTC